MGLQDKVASVMAQVQQRAGGKKPNIKTYGLTKKEVGDLMMRRALVNDHKYQVNLIEKDIQDYVDTNIRPRLALEEDLIPHIDLMAGTISINPEMRIPKAEAKVEQVVTQAQGPEAAPVSEAPKEEVKPDVVPPAVPTQAEPAAPEVPATPEPVVAPEPAPIDPAPAPPGQ